MIKNIIKKSILLFAIIALIVSCNYTPKKHTIGETDQQEQHADKTKDCSHVHWSHHEGEEGPENWVNLCDGFSSCGGETQSPINIISRETTMVDSLKGLIVDYNTTNVDIINNGHTVQFNTLGDNDLIIGEKAYRLLQFHYHAQSEHAVNGEKFPLEIHFVHKYSDADYAVLGLMFEIGEENTLFKNYLSHFPTEKGSYTSEDLIQLKNLLPADLSYYYYSGSLTTPPCSEVVRWYLLKNPITASKEQIELFSGILHGNYRPIMPVNGRKIYHFSEN